MRRCVVLGRTWVPLLVGWMLCCSAKAAPVTELRVLSFNIWVQGGLSLSNCIEVIRTTDADLVGLQECNATTAQIIADGLGFHVLQANDDSIVSRYPILSSHLIGNSRGVTVELSPGQRAHLFNCHLTPFPYGPYSYHDGQSQSFVIDQENQVRMPGLNQLLDAMQPWIAGGEPCFLVGDFNAPSHLDYASFPWPTSLACINAGLEDSYRELHPGNRTFPPAFAFDEPGITWTPKLSQEPDGVFDRIDFVYFSTGDGTTPASSVELDERNSINPWPSDHRAVLTTFTLTPPMPLDKASLPLPQNEATKVATDVILSWLPGINATSHAVFVETNVPGTLLTNTTMASVSLTGLQSLTEYYWRVDESTPTGVVLGDVWSFTTRGTNATVYEWDFAQGNLLPALGSGVMDYADGSATSNLTLFGSTDGSTVPHIEGKPATFLRAPAFADRRNGYLVTFSDSGPNGGGTYINQFTMIFDILFPAPAGWMPFFNTAPDNPSGNDADFYVAPDGSLGIAAIGYSPAGTIAIDTWYRIAFAADLSAGIVTYYVNGYPVASGSAAADGRFSIYSNQDPGADLLLFNEGDASGVYTHATYLSSFLFTDRSMSAAEILAVGGAQAWGILVPQTPINLAIELGPGEATLHWSGGEGPYQVQTTASMTNTWQDIGSSTSNTNAIVPRNSQGAFFRVVGQ